MKKLIQALRTLATALYEMRDAAPDEQAKQLDHAGLSLEVLAHIVNGKTVERAFGAPGDWGYGTPIGDGLRAMLSEPQPVACPWIAVEDRLPTHLHSVLGWVTSGGLVVDDPFADVVSYDPERKTWLECVNGEDAFVTVSHWMPLPVKPAAKGGAR
jgi:hypothetical protein